MFVSPVTMHRSRRMEWPLRAWPARICLNPGLLEGPYIVRLEGCFRPGAVLIVSRKWCVEMSIRFFVVGIILLIFLASQFYWLRVAWNLLRRRITRASRRRAVASVALLGFAFLFVYNLGFLGRTSPTHMTLRVALLEVPFKLWFFGS